MIWPSFFIIFQDFLVKYKNLDWADLQGESSDKNNKTWLGIFHYKFVKNWTAKEFYDITTSDPFAFFSSEYECTDILLCIDKKLECAKLRNIFNAKKYWY